MQRAVADCAPPTPTRTRVGPGFSRVAVLQVVMAIAAVAMCCRGEGHPFRWLVAALVLPVASLILSTEYRKHVLARCRQLWTSLQDAGTGFRQPLVATFCLVVAPAALLFLSNDRSPDTGDTWPVIATAASVTTTGSLRLDRFIDSAPSAYRIAANDDLPYCVVQRPSGIYSSYPSGMVPFALPATVVARLLGADLQSPKAQKHLEKWVASWVSALALGLFFLSARKLAPTRAALVATALLASASVFFSVCGQNLWQHDGVIFWMLLVLCVEFDESLRSVWYGTLVQGLACGMMAACRLSATLFLLPFGLWLLARAPKRALMLAASAAICYTPWAWFYATTYGNVFGPSTGQMAEGNWAWSFQGLWGILISPSHGALVYQPWLLLAFLSVAVGRARTDQPSGTPPGWGWLCVAVAVLQVAMVSGWCRWWGGHSWGSRLAAEAIPLAALLCVRPIAWLLELSAGKYILAPLALSGFLLHAVANYGHADRWDNLYDVDRHTEVLWSWSRPPFLYPLQSHGN
jgi:hypothetical protein